MFNQSGIQEVRSLGGSNLEKPTLLQQLQMRETELMRQLDAVRAGIKAVNDNPGVLEVIQTLSRVGGLC